MPEDDGWVTKFQGYSDYEFVSRRIGVAVDEAVDAYSSIRALHAEGAKIRPEKAATARQRILAAAIRILVEIENQNDDDEYADILERWTTDEDSGEPGYLDKIAEIQLQHSCPDWLYQLTKDIRTAGWKLGYLQAGKQTRERTDDSPEADAQEMFSNL